MRALGYVRASTDKQSHTLEAQQAAIAAWCAAEGVDLTWVQTDADVSGTVPFAERPGAAMLLAMAASSDAAIDLIVTTTVDRLFRNTLDGLTCLHQTFPKLGLSAVAVYEAIDTRTPEGKFQTTMKLALAELERDKTAERTRRTSERLQATGRVYGATPFGCVAVDGKLYRDPEAWHTRQRIVDALGADSIRAVQLSLRALRILSPSGSRTWSTSTLKNLRDTHDRLALLPRIGDAGQGGSVAYGAPEATVSPIRGARHA